MAVLSLRRKFGVESLPVVRMFESKLKVGDSNSESSREAVEHSKVVLVLTFGVIYLPDSLFTLLISWLSLP